MWYPFRVNSQWRDGIDDDKALASVGVREAGRIALADCVQDTALVQMA